MCKSGYDFGPAAEIEKNNTEIVINARVVSNATNDDFLENQRPGTQSTNITNAAIPCAEAEPILASVPIGKFFLTVPNIH